jgi:hypothetical protein
MITYQVHYWLDPIALLESPIHDVSLSLFGIQDPQCSGGQHYTLGNSYIETLQHILPNIPDNGTIDSWLPRPCAELWTVENTQD